MMVRVLELDPAGGIRAFRSMLRGLIAMPGRLDEVIDDGDVVADGVDVDALGDDREVIEQIEISAVVHEPPGTSRGGR